MYSSTVIFTALLKVLHLYFAALPIRTVIGPVTIICVAVSNLRHLYFTALSALTVIEPITIVQTRSTTPRLFSAYN